MRLLGAVAAIVLVASGGQAWAQGAAGEEAAATQGAAEATAPVVETPPPAAPESVTQPAAAPATMSDEQKALEADMAAAHGKVEEIKAAPVTEGTGTKSEASGGAEQTAAQARMSGTVGLDTDRPYGLMIVFDHSVGSGTFIKDDTLQAARAYASQTWDIRPHYRFDIGEHKLKLMARILFEIEYTTPDGPSGRRFKPSDCSLSLSDASLYTETLTGITFNLGARVTFPTSYESIGVKRQWAGLSGIAGARRAFGPVMLSYGFTFTKYLNDTKAGIVSTTTPRSGDQLYLTGTGSDDPSALPAGKMNTSFALINTVELGWSITDNLSVTYSLAFWNTFAYTDKNVNVVDEHTSPNADDSRGRGDSLWPTLDISYTLDEVLKPVVELPFSFSISAGITALHPAQHWTKKDGWQINWPFFYEPFVNHTADNAGTIYLDLVGIY